MRSIDPTSLRPGRRAGILAVITGAAGLLVTGLSGPAAGADPYVAGSDATRADPLAGTAASAAAARAATHERALGLPGPARRVVERVTDRRAATTYDEVTDLDGRDRPTAVLRYAPDGRLVAAVRLGWPTGSGRVLATPADAVGAGQAAARAVGLDPLGRPKAQLRGTNGWTVSWDRIADGVPVPGDGTRVQLWPDGSFHALATSERELAHRPSAEIPRAAAEAIVGRLLDRWIPGPARAEARIETVDLAWVAPNDTFESWRPDAPGDVLRLGWLVRVRSSGGLAATIRGLEVAIDAGDGSLLGGDVLR